MWLIPSLFKLSSTKERIVFIKFYFSLEMDLALTYKEKFGPLPEYKKFLDFVIGGDVKVPAGEEPPNTDVAPVKYKYKWKE